MGKRQKPEKSHSTYAKVPDNGTYYVTAEKPMSGYKAFNEEVSWEDKKNKRSVERGKIMPQVLSGYILICIVFLVTWRPYFASAGTHLFVSFLLLSPSILLYIHTKVHEPKDSASVAESGHSYGVKLPTFQKMTILLGPSRSHKSEKVFALIDRTHCRNRRTTNICCISGVDVNGQHIQMSPEELKELILHNREKDTIFLLVRFWFGFDRKAYLDVIEKACNNGIRVYKTDIKLEHITDDVDWINKYCSVFAVQD